jgi:heptosyltransferase II
MNSWKPSFLRTVDTVIGKSLVLIISTLTPTKIANQPSSIKNIAVIRLWAMGESILALPAINALKQAQPDTKITVITTPYVAPVFYNQPTINNVHIVKPNILSLTRYALKHRHHFDIVVDFEPYLFVSALLAWSTGKWRVGFATRERQKIYNESVKYDDQQHVVYTNLDLIKSMSGNIKKKPRLPNLNYSVKDSEKVETILNKKALYKEQDFILLAPSVGKSALYRMWPWQRFAKLADQLVYINKKQIVWIGDKSDEALINTIRKTMKHDSHSITNISLNQLFYLVSQAQLLIANDSGIMHIGAAMKTHTLGLFGPNTPVRFAPFGKNNKSIYHPTKGSPHINIHKGKIPITRSTQCAQAMMSIQVDEVNKLANLMLLETQQLDSSNSPRF